MSEVKQGRAESDFYFPFLKNSEISDRCLLYMGMRLWFQKFFTDCVDERE